MSYYIKLDERMVKDFSHKERNEEIRSAIETRDYLLFLKLFRHTNFYNNDLDILRSIANLCSNDRVVAFIDKEKEID